MGYLFLALGIVMEGCATIFLKNANGFTVIAPTILCFVCSILCNVFISKSLGTIKMSLAYATWYGSGVMIAALLSVFLYHEGIDIISVVGILVIVIGIVITNLGETSTESVRK